jgi:DNA-binding NarL/FixJ family response regulator
MLSQQPDLEVVGEAKDGQEALMLSRRLRPELVLMDLRMPNMDGLEATRAIKWECPRVAVMILTAFGDEGYLAEALAAGADGYVLKHSSNQRIIESIRGVLGGEYAVDQQLAMRLLVHLAKDKLEEQRETARSAAPEGDGDPRVGHRAPVPSRPVTLKEVEVLGLLAQGQTNYQIARSLNIGFSTVKDHLRQIYSKLGVCDRTQAVVRALELGLISLRDPD